MFATIAWLLSPVLQFPLIRAVRRNHGMEHGTVHLLNRQRYTPSGVASLTGFTLIGDVPTEKVTKAAEDALKRFRKGEADLAVHPQCGTNLATGAFLTTLIGALGFTGASRQQTRERFSTVMLLMLVASIFSAPLGMQIQKHFTTTGEMGDLEVVGVSRREVRLPNGSVMVVHHITTHGA